jgi:hypothetical protein
MCTCHSAELCGVDVSAVSTFRFNLSATHAAARTVSLACVNRTVHIVCSCSDIVAWVILLFILCFLRVVFLTDSHAEVLLRHPESSCPFPPSQPIVCPRPASQACGHGRLGMVHADLLLLRLLHLLHLLHRPAHCTGFTSGIGTAEGSAGLWQELGLPFSASKPKCAVDTLIFSAPKVWPQHGAKECQSIHCI